MKKTLFNFKTFLFLIALFTFVAPTSFAQKNTTNELNLPKGKNKGIAREKYTLLIDAVNNGQYEEGIEPLSWILENAPNLHADVYVKAVKLYIGLAEKAKEDGADSKVKEYQDKIAEMYKLRIENDLAEDMSDIYHRFGLDAYFYWKDNPEKIDTLYKHYQKTYELDRAHFSRSEVIYYADIAGKEYQQEFITLDKLTDIYKELKTYVNERIKEEETQEEKDKWKEYVLDKIDELELIYFPKDCNRISELFGEKLKANPNDTLLVNRVVKLMADNGCTKDSLFLVAMTSLYKINPSSAVATTIGQLHMQNKDTDNALVWIEKSLEGASEEDKAKAANTVLTLSKVAYKDGKYTKARSLALKAAGMGNREVAAEAHTFIGDLYMSTYKQCMSGSDIVQKRAVFLAAYDMYAKGGNSAKMASAKAQFPTKENIFETNKYKIGDAMTVGCWINTTTTLRAK